MNNNSRPIRWWIPLVAIVAAWLLALASCSRGAPPVSALNPEPGKVVSKMIVGMAMYMPDTWPNSPYMRSGDLMTEWPAFIAIAADGTGCIVSGEIMVASHYGDRLYCAGGWRSQRPVH